jgi:two-component system OmpR family sensor kinase
LTALQLHATLIERAATDADRAGAVADLKRGLVRTSHTVQQLLTLARVEPGGAAPLPFSRVDLASLASRVAADHTLLAESRCIDLGLCESIADVSVRGDAEALQTLLANLVENAIRYTPSPGRVDIDVAIVDGKPLLSVADSGPGIPPHERRRVFDRFYRRRESLETGSGLGLAIVRAIADRHGAEIELGESPLGGLLASVHFPS